MPVHDWTRVDAGIFHHFHNMWIASLSNALNGGVLPENYYALVEQHAGQKIPDILTLHAGSRTSTTSGAPGPVALADAPPKVSRKMTLTPANSYRALRRTLAVRHVSDHRVVAMLEIVSPANKDRPASIKKFVEKVVTGLDAGIHFLIVDLFAPGSSDPQGIHGAICEALDAAVEDLPADKPMTLVAYAAGRSPEAFIESLAIGDALPDMPLFYEDERYVNVPLESTYGEAYPHVPAIWREVIER